MIKALQVIAQAGITIVGSIGVLLLLGTQIYVLVAAAIALVIFMLVMTSSARLSTSTNPDVVLRPVPWISWSIGSIALALVMGGFWPVLPVVLALRKASERADVGRDLYVSRDDRDSL